MKQVCKDGQRYGLGKRAEVVKGGKKGKMWTEVVKVLTVNREVTKQKEEVR